LLNGVLHGYDVIIFSEAFDKESKETLVSSLKLIGYAYNTPNVGKAGLITLDGGVFIASKHPILAHQEMTFGGVCKGSDCMSDKGAMYTKIQFKNEVIHVIGTHMQAHDGNHDVRVAQMKLIRSFIDKMNIPKNEMVLIGGDTNVEKFKPKEFNDMLSTFRVKSPKFIGLKYTVDGEINRLADTQGGKAVEYLDYVLWDPSHKSPNEEISFVSSMCSKTIRPWKQFAWEKDYWDLSDHFPVYAHLAI
jgi:phospholipase C